MDKNFALIKSMIRDTYRRSGDQPLLLARFGESLRRMYRLETGEDWPHVLKISDIIAEMPDFEIAPLGKGGAATIRRIGQTEGLPVSNDSASGLKYSIRTAFTTYPEPGNSIYIQRERPHSFREMPGGGSYEGWIEIADDFRAPEDGSACNDGNSDGERLLLRIENWANANDFPREELFFSNPVKKREFPAGNALERFLAAQDADILPRLVLPGDIIQILLRN